MTANKVIDQVGHGAFGLRSGLKTFQDWLDETADRKDVTVDIRPGMVVTGWAVDTGSTYVAAVDLTFDGVRLDVVSVRSLLDSGLTRAESVALCRSTAGTFYYDPDQEFGTAFTWDSSFWDDGVSYWDQFAQVYVHLTDGSNPASTSVSVQFGIHYATRGMIQPDLGPEKSIDGSFEIWTSPTDLTNWNENISAGHTINRESTIVKSGTYSLRLSSDGSAATGNCSVRPNTQHDCIVGKMYRATCYYYTPIGFDTRHIVTMGLQQFGGTDWLDADGRTVSTTKPTNIGLSPTNGEWRRAVFDFIAPWTGVKVRFEIETTVTVAADCYFDVLTFQRIWRFNYYEPRVATHSIPAVDTGSNDIYFGGKRIGIGSISLNNGDGTLEKLVGQLEWLNHDFFVWSGGEFMNGQEITFEDQRRQFTGLIQAYNVDDETVVFDLQDSRTFFHTQLPLDFYSESRFPNIDPRKVGTPRPLWFGAKEKINPTRIDYESTFVKYGVYELADCTLAPNGIKALTAVNAYTSDANAQLDLISQRLTLTPGTHYSTDLTTGRFTIVVDVGPYLVDATNSKLNFDVGAAELTASIAVGLYSAAGLAAQIQTQLRTAVGGGDTTMTCTYSETTNKFTIAKSSGTLNLRTNNGTNKDITGYSLIGFDRTANKTGALTYLGDSATFSSADASHNLRCDGQGFKDTAAGKYTGTASALIQVGGDICQVLVEKYLSKPYAIIDQTSFVDARTSAPESLAIYLNDVQSTKDIFDRLEFSNVANIVIDGSGNIFYKVYQGAVSSTILDLYDQDFLHNGFTGSRAVTDVYRGILVNYDKNPSTGEFRGASDSDSSVALRFGRTDQREFETYIKIGDNAASLATRLLTLAKRPARKFKVVTRSKLIDKEVGDKIRITRKRAFDANGKMSGQVFRIIGIKKDPLDGKIEADVVDDLQTVAGIQCITACQLVCELTAQSTCIVACQETCQLHTCQTGCQAVCQGCGQTVCQSTCENTNQTVCVTGCQVACQTTCQVHCQSCNQAGNCQTTCETTCQGCGQTVCQQSCQLACQTGCQQTCQAACQFACQQSSEHSHGL